MTLKEFVEIYYPNQIESSVGGIAGGNGFGSRTIVLRGEGEFRKSPCSRTRDGEHMHYYGNGETCGRCFSNYNQLPVELITVCWSTRPIGDDYESYVGRGEMAQEILSAYNTLAH